MKMLIKRGRIKGLMENDSYLRIQEEAHSSYTL